MLPFFSKSTFTERKKIRSEIRRGHGERIFLDLDLFKMDALFLSLCMSSDSESVLCSV